MVATMDREPGAIQAAPGRRNRTGRTEGSGIFARRQAERISREDLVARARLLPTVPQALVTAYYGLGMSIAELAALHKTTRHHLYRALMHWRDTLSDRSFLLAAHFAGRLPRGRAELARAHWMEGRTLRELARARRTTIHGIRTELAEARVDLATASLNRQGPPVDAEPE